MVSLTKQLKKKDQTIAFATRLIECNAEHSPRPRNIEIDKNQDGEIMSIRKIHENFEISVAGKVKLETPLAWWRTQKEVMIH